MEVRVILSFYPHKFERLEFCIYVYVLKSSFSIITYQCRMFDFRYFTTPYKFHMQGFYSITKILLQIDHCGYMHRLRCDQRFKNLNFPSKRQPPLFPYIQQCVTIKRQGVKIFLVCMQLFVGEVHLHRAGWVVRCLALPNQQASHFSTLIFSDENS